MAARGDKRQISTSDSNCSYEVGTNDGSKSKKVSLKPDPKKSKNIQGKQQEDQTSIKQFTKSKHLTDSTELDIKSVAAQLVLINERLITKEDLKTELEKTKNDILIQLNERLEKLELRILTVEIEKDKLKKENSDLKKKCEKLQDDVHSAVFSSKLALDKHNSLEQYTRKNSVRIFGVADTNKYETAEESVEKTVGVLAKIGVTVTIADIDIAHRIGKFDQGKTRPIIAKFVSRIHKNQALQHRRKLKGTRMGISEDLTATNVAYLKKLQEHENVSAAWTKDTQFYVKLKSNEQVTRVEPAIFLKDQTDDSDIEDNYAY